MQQYLYETYSTFLMLFLFSWILWVIAVIAVVIALVETESKYKASIRYYAIIFTVLSLITGVLLSIFLPSKEAMKLFLGL